MNIVGSIDVAQIMLYAFWIFFAALVVYLRREDKREGYPMESSDGPRTGWPATPGPKVFVAREGGEPMAGRGGEP